MEPIVIVGSGMAGYGLAREFRKRNSEQPLTILTADDGAVYSKPLLSTALAQGQAADQLQQHTAEALADQLGVQIRTQTRVERIDTSSRQLHVDGSCLSYRHLVLALGADPVDPGLAGDAADRVMRVNDLQDYRRFRNRLQGRRRVVILGGGLIGCEFANDLILAGYAVDLVHPREWPLERLLPPALGAVFVDQTRERGLNWHLQRKARAVWHAGDDVRVELDNGDSLTADLVLSAIGLRPRTTLARDAGLQVARGIVVDRRLNASVPSVSAIGDCAEVDGLVLPYVQPLLTQVRTLAALLAGEDTALTYPAMPVTIKTPILPLVVGGVAPEPGQCWQTDAVDGGWRSCLYAADGSLQGFALAGAATRERSTLAKQLPPLL